MGGCSFFVEMQNFYQLIEQKAHASSDELMQWMSALAQGESLVQSGVLSGAIFAEALEAVESAHALAGWVALLDGHAREFPHEPNGAGLLAACVEKSPFSLEMWLEALGYFYDWMCVRKSAVTLEEALAYLRQCEVQALGEMPTGTLYRAVVDALDVYGVEEL